MRILGIDGATERTGIALLDMNILSYNHLIHISGSSAQARINPMTLTIIGEIVAQKPDIVYYEDTFENRKVCNPKTLKQLSEVMGGVRAYCAYNSIEFKLILPSSWRKVLGFNSKKRTDAKQEAIHYVNQKYGITVGDDVADAICIATAGSLLENKENNNES